MKVLLAAILLSVALCSCIKTKVKGYTDADYHSRQVSRVAIHVLDAPLNFSEALERRAVARLSKLGVTAIPLYQILPPTRNYTVDERRNALGAARVEAVLMFSLGYSESSERLIGMYGSSNSNTYLSGTVSSYGSTSYISGTGTTNTTTYSTPVIASNRNSGGSAALWDWQAGRAIWVGTFSTESGGAFYQSDGKHAYSAADSVIQELVNSKHFIARIE